MMPTLEVAPVPKTQLATRPTALLLLICSLIALLMPLNPPEAHAKTYKVSPGDNLQAAADKLEPGDTLKLAKGTYNDYVTFNSSGRKGKPIAITGTVDSTDEERPASILDGSSLNWRYPITISGSYMALSNLGTKKFVRDKIPGYGIGIDDGSHHITITNLSVTGPGSAVKMASAGGTNRRITLNSIYGTNLTTGGIDCGPGKCYGLTVAGGMLFGPGKGNDTATDGIAVEGGRNIRITGAVVKGFQGDGIDIKASRTLIHTVTVTNNGREGIKLWKGGTIYGSRVTDNQLAQLVLTGTSRSAKYSINTSVFSGRPTYGYQLELGGRSVKLSRNHIAANKKTNEGTAIWLTAPKILGDWNRIWSPYRTDTVIDWNGSSYSSTMLMEGNWPGNMDSTNCYCETG